MTLRAQFKINAIAIDGTNPLQLNIILNNGKADNYGKYSAFQNEDDNADVDILRKKKNMGGIASNADNVTTNSPLRTVRIVCSDEKERDKIFNLINLKDKIKAARTIGGASWRINIEKINYDASGAGTNVLTIDDGAGAVGNTTLTLETTEFGGIDNLNINNYTWAANAARTLVDNFSTQKARLLEVENKINDLRDYYQDETTALRDEKTTNTAFLNTLKTAVRGGIPNVATDIDYTLYQDFAVAGNQVYRAKIDQWHHFLTETKKWMDHAKFNKVEQILKANANGFILEDTWNIKNDYSGAEMNYGTNCPNAITDAELTNKLIENGKYKGFDITEGAEIKSPAEDNTTFNPTNLNNKDKRSREIFGKNAMVNVKRYKLQIDNFRAVGGAFTDESITDPKALRGFQPGDIGADGKSTLTGHDIASTTDKLQVARDGKFHPHGHASAGDPVNALVEFSQAEMTKKQFDILDLMSGSANDELDNIIRIAFLENDFKEVDGKTQAELLQMYWDVIRAVNGGGGTNNGLFHSGTLKQHYNEVKKLKIAQTATSADEKANVKKLERLESIYEYVKEFVDLYFGTAPTTEADFTTWKGKIKKYTETTAENADEKAFNIVWSGKIID
ncbi:MAG: hypothetical protein I3275_06115, partial [Candidatus Moeniiplasma glomeromycotorum]|nr:hypothetical protein [Candidatus Moeniiplasma glomeromycotorum]